MAKNGWTANIVKEDDERELKISFAREFLRTPDNMFKAALSIFPDSTNKALKVSYDWPKDKIVLDEIQRLKQEEGEESFLPTKADLARSLWERAQSSLNDDYVKITRLYAEIMDFIPKNSKNDDKLTATVRIIASPEDEKL